MPSLSLVVSAHQPTNGIGKDNRIVWTIPEDLAYFRKVTTETTNSSLLNAVVMGKRTWLSIPEKFRPLKGRKNVVISSNPDVRQELELHDDVLTATSLDQAIKLLEDQVETIHIIGGAALYEEALRHPLCDIIHLTEVEGESLNSSDSFDTFFPPIPARDYQLFSRTEWKPVNDSDLKYRIAVYHSINYSQKKRGRKVDSDGSVVPSLEDQFITFSPNPEEGQYLMLIKKILTQGVVKGDRTGTGTISIFGAQMKFSLRNGVFPLLTTKKVFTRGIIEELFWFIRGSTNANILREKNIHIWDGNGSREFLDKLGLTHREEGDLGPVYGFQWRHFGAEYKDMHANYEGQGIDQLMECIRKIKETPEDRRIIMSAWNPMDLNKMALPPCHMFCQFYVSKRGADTELSCQMYQRSADMGLGVPFNIASYALLTILVAHTCGLKPGEFVHTIGDCHVYLNHTSALEEQLTRTPRAFPKISLTCDPKPIEEYCLADIKIEGYNPHETIKMKMAV